MWKFVVATYYGGTHETRGEGFGDAELMEAEIKQEAIDEYNRIKKSSYFYGSCIAEIFDDSSFRMFTNDAELWLVTKFIPKIDLLDPGNLYYEVRRV